MKRIKFKLMELFKKPPLPHSYKKFVVKDFAKKYRAENFIETGTYLGHMIDAVKDIFLDIWSIELSKELAEKASKKFSGEPNIRILQGDSAEKLPEILNSLDSPAVFWLDGHYSGGVTARGSKDTPVVQELGAILDHNINSHIVLIDDARLFNGSSDYPTVSEVKDLVKSKYRRMEIKGDIIRIYN